MGVSKKRQLLAAPKSATINYTPHASAWMIHQSRAQVKAVCGPVGCGKSTMAIWDFFFLCKESKVPIRGCVIRESYRELADSTRKTFEEWFGPICSYHESSETARLTFPGDDGVIRTHELMFRSCRKAEEASKFLSTEFAFIWLEEPVPAYSNSGVMGGGLDIELFKLVLMRVRQKDAPRYEVILTFNPPTSRHWVYNEFFKRDLQELAKMDYSLFRVPRIENEKNLRAGYYDQLLNVLSPDLAKRFVEGEIVTVYPGEAVYKEARESWHIAEDVPYVEGVPLVLGFDAGRTPCCLITQILPSGQWRWLAEIQLLDASMDQLADTLGPFIRSRFPQATWRCWIDPAGFAGGQGVSASPAEVLAERGFQTQPGAMEWFPRRETMKQRLSRSIFEQPCVLISRSGCPNSVEGILGGYRYPKNFEGRTAEQPLKNEFSHLLNAAEYIATGEFTAVDQTKPLKRKIAVRPIGFAGWNPLDPPKSSGRSGYSWLKR